MRKRIRTWKSIKIEDAKQRIRRKRKEYEHQRKNCKRVLRQKRRKHMKNIIKEIEEKYKNKEVVKRYSGLNKEGNGFQPKNDNIIKNGRTSEGRVRDIRNVEKSF